MQWRPPITRLADTNEQIFIGKGEQPAWLTLGLANRHGLVTGATGTGKTVSLQVMAEGFARAGVPVFAADIKGDLSGISEVGEAKDFIRQARPRHGAHLPARPVFDRILGRVWRAGPSGARHRLGNGTAAAVADDGSERCAGRRAERCLSRRGRERTCADRHEGSAEPAGCNRARQQGGRRCARVDPQGRPKFRKCHQSNRWNHPTPASGVGKSGRRRIFSASRRWR